ncbi:hypothetical protein CCY99_05330 [Helicobacter sp. 16-1353]|uniref:molybdopterin molybdotransferase MoeA n=1 Tax=Helicobacter sp. 16-1353 TaxID=2004996 RepID=UPI000DCE2FEA|nr:molybdopterin molybdotransferase MoeA [Helicobacter sp. 16-1353]RAX54102.1 hypothetical protein CCY99_05330 [Helicobacter sp. 16-1353]
MLNLDEFFDFLYKLQVKTKGCKEIGLDSALHRILYEDIICKYNVPRFDNSAMDGYALRIGHKSYVIKDSIFAGNKVKINLKNNEAVKIMTGARIPKGAQAVIQKELTTLKDNNLFLDSTPQLNQSIKLKGEDFKKGEILLKKGALIDAQSIGILASQGIDKVKVAKKVKIIIFGSGNEIARLDSKLNENQIYDINSYFLKSILSPLNCSIKYGGILDDNVDSISKSLQKALKKYDIVITSGGVSVGDKDYIHKVLEKIDAKILVDSINIKPGRPMIFSNKDSKFILSLPGNPIGAFFHCMFCMSILIQKMSLSKDLYFKEINAINKTDFFVTNKTSHIVLGNFENGYFSAYNNAKYQGAQIAPLMKSNSLAIFNNKDMVKKDSIIKIILYKPEFFDRIKNIFN